jgi:hypothetical protein
LKKREEKASQEIVEEIEDNQDSSDEDNDIFA